MLIRQALGSGEGDLRGECTEADCRAALTRCIERGLLKLLSPSDFDSEGHRRDLGDTPLAAAEGFDDYAPGDVDFTAEGYRVYRAVTDAIFHASAT